MTEKIKETFEKSDNCWIRESNFEKVDFLVAQLTDENVNRPNEVNKKNLRKEHKLTKVKDLDHLTDKFRGVGRVVGNLKAISPYTCFMPMVVHILFRHDSLFFIAELIRQKPKKIKFSVIPKTKPELLSYN